MNQNHDVAHLLQPLRDFLAPLNIKFYSRPVVRNCAAEISIAFRCRDGNRSPPFGGTPVPLG